MSNIILCDGCKQVDAKCLFKIHFALYIKQQPKMNHPLEEQINANESDLCQKCFDTIKWLTRDPACMVTKYLDATKYYTELQRQRG